MHNGTSLVAAAVTCKPERLTPLSNSGPPTAVASAITLLDPKSSRSPPPPKVKLRVIPRAEEYSFRWGWKVSVTS